MLMQEEIERLIMTGELPVGSRINESEPRSASTPAAALSARRCVRWKRPASCATKRTVGVFVREIAFEEADEIYELREALEEIIGRRVALAIKPDAVERLRAMLDAMRSAAQAQDVEQYAQLNLQFHEILLDTAGSKKLTETYKRLVKELHLFRMRALDSGGGLRVSADEHRDIVDAIASGDPDTAGRALRQHVAGSRARMHKAFGRADSDAATASNNPPQKEV